MKKIKILALAFVTILSLTAFQANAQKIAVGGSLGLFSFNEEGSDAEFGFSATGKYSLNESMRVGANLGYYSRNTVKAFLGNIIVILHLQCRLQDFLSTFSFKGKSGPMPEQILAFIESVLPETEPPFRIQVLASHLSVELTMTLMKRFA